MDQLVSATKVLGMMVHTWEIRQRYILRLTNRRKDIRGNDAFGTSLREYELRVLRYVNELIQSPERERAKGSGVVDIGMYFSFFIFDVMGDLA